MTHDEPPVTGGTLSLTAARYHDQLCTEFEDRLRKGQSPRIEDVLGLIPAEERCALFEALLRIEFELQPSPLGRREEYLARFPVYTGVVDSLLSEHFAFGQQGTPGEVGASANELSLPSLPAELNLTSGANQNTTIFGSTAPASCEEIRRFGEFELLD